MKELEEQVKIEASVEKQVKKEEKFLGSMKLSPGHKCWELDLNTLHIKEAEYKKIAINFAAAQKGEISRMRKLLTKESCIYVTALNMKNARKKFTIMLREKNEQFKELKIKEIILDK